MAEDSHASDVLALLARLDQGDDAASDELLERTSERLTRLTRAMLSNYPTVARWEQTDDVFVNAMMRLHRALKFVTPPTPLDYFRLAATMIRRELIDMARHYSGPEGIGAHHASQGADRSQGSAPAFEPPDSTHDPARLAHWVEFHQQVECLEGKLYQVFDLLFYDGLTQAEAAEALSVSEKTVARRWQAARLALVASLGERLPGF